MQSSVTHQISIIIIENLVFFASFLHLEYTYAIFFFSQNKFKQYINFKINNVLIYFMRKEVWLFLRTERKLLVYQRIKRVNFLGESIIQNLNNI